MDNTHDNEISEDEKAAGQAMIRAAFDAFGKTPPLELSTEDVARLTVLAMAAAHEANRSIQETLPNCFSYISAEDAVFSAFSAWQIGATREQIDSYALHSVGGCLMKGFVKGIMATHAMSQALDFLDSEDHSLAYIAISARTLALIPD